MTNIRKFLFYALAATFCFSAPAHARECQLRIAGTMDIVTGSDGRLLVPVTVEGQKVYFRLDIGSPVSAILASTTDSLHLKRSIIEGHIFVSIDDQDMKERVTPELGLGGPTGPAILGVTPALDKADPREVGVLGFDILRDYDVELDLTHNKLNLFSPDHCSHQVIYWTRTAPVAALPIRTPGLADFSVVMQLDGKDMQTKISTADDRAYLSTRVAKKTFGIVTPEDAASDNPKPYPFKVLLVDGLIFMNPAIYPYVDDTANGCNGNTYEEKQPLHTEAHGLIVQCYGVPDLFIGLAELRKLHVFFDFSEKMLYATAADAQ